ncbi:MAG: hypothetical protein RLZZ480_416 [Candidatus Parcubacteria bacterium]|jgi:hypothetical protein
MFGFEINTLLIGIIVVVFIFVGFGFLLYERGFNRTELTADTVEDFIRSVCKSKGLEGSMTIRSDSAGKIGGLVYTPRAIGGSSIEFDAKGKKVSSLTAVEAFRPDDFGKSDQAQASQEYNQMLESFPIENKYSCDAI